MLIKISFLLINLMILNTKCNSMESKSEDNQNEVSSSVDLRQQDEISNTLDNKNSPSTVQDQEVTSSNIQDQQIKPSNIEDQDNTFSEDDLNVDEGIFADPAVKEIIDSIDTDTNFESISPKDLDSLSVTNKNDDILPNNKFDN